MLMTSLRCHSNAQQKSSAAGCSTVNDVDDDADTALTSQNFCPFLGFFSVHLSAFGKDIIVLHGVCLSVCSSVGML